MSSPLNYLYNDSPGTPKKDTTILEDLGLEEFGSGGKYHKYYEMVEDGFKLGLEHKSQENIKQEEQRRSYQNAQQNTSGNRFSISDHKDTIVYLGLGAAVLFFMIK